MSIRSVSLLAAVALAGLAVAALAQGGAFDPSPAPEAIEAAEAAQDAADDAASASEEPQGVSDEIVYESYEVVQPIPDETPGPAARTIEPPEEVAGEWVEAEAAPEPVAAPARRSKLIKLERIAQAPAASPARDKRVRISQ